MSEPTLIERLRMVGAPKGDFPAVRGLYAEAASALAAAEAREKRVKKAYMKRLKAWADERDDAEQVLREIAAECEKQAVLPENPDSKAGKYLQGANAAYRNAASLIRSRLPDPEPVSEDQDA